MLSVAFFLALAHEGSNMIVFSPQDGFGHGNDPQTGGVVFCVYALSVKVTNRMIYYFR